MRKWGIFSQSIGLYRVGKGGEEEVLNSVKSTNIFQYFFSHKIQAPDTSIMILAQLFEIGPNLMKGAKYH